MSDDDFKKAVGFKEAENGQETVIQYTERMCGIAALYFSVLYTLAKNGILYFFKFASFSISLGQRIPGVGNGWSWMARIVNLIPRKITPSLIFTFLEVIHKKKQEKGIYAHKDVRVRLYSRVR